VAALSHLVHLAAKVLHLLHLLHHILSFALPLFLQFLPALQLPLPLNFFLLFLLHLHDPGVHLDKQMRELTVNFVNKVAEISGSLVVNPLEKHNCIEVLGEILGFVVREFTLEDLHNFLLLR
jgi:hypothetical protein